MACTPLARQWLDTARVRCLVAATLEEARAAVDAAALAVMCVGADGDMQALLVGHRAPLEHDDTVVHVTAIAIAADVDVAAAMKRMLRRLMRSGTVRGVTMHAAPEDVLLRCGFREADIREDRYDVTRLCYSPVYRLGGDDGRVRLSRILISGSH